LVAQIELGRADGYTGATCAPSERRAARRALRCMGGGAVGDFRKYAYEARYGMPTEY